MFVYVGMVNILTEMLTLLAFVILMCTTIRQAIKEKKEFFIEFWNYVTICTIVMFLIAMSLYAYRSVLTVSTVELMMNNLGKVC